MEIQAGWGLWMEPGNPLAMRHALGENVALLFATDVDSVSEGGTFAMRLAEPVGSRISRNDDFRGIPNGE